LILIILIALMADAIRRVSEHEYHSYHAHIPALGRLTLTSWELSMAPIHIGGSRLPVFDEHAPLSLMTLPESAATLIDQDADWSAHGIGDPLAPQAKATVWAHTEASPSVWKATTPVAAYSLLLLIDDARLSLRSDSHEVPERDCEAGSYYVSRPGETVSVHCAGPCRALHVTVPVHLFWCGNDAGRSCFSLGPARDALLLQFARALLAIQGDAQNNPLAAPVMELMVGRLQQLRMQAAPAAAVVKKTTLPNWRLQRVDKHVQAHLSERITLHDMAAAAGLSPMHFAAQFRAATGYRPHHYLLLCRLEKAKQLMADPSRSVLDIALEVGFQTQSHFTTVFKRLAGKTPGQWRSEHLSASCNGQTRPWKTAVR
jgi:AraC-like DNA-binding protein